MSRRTPPLLARTLPLFAALIWGPVAGCQSSADVQVQQAAPGFGRGALARGTVAILPVTFFSRAASQPGYDSVLEAAVSDAAGGATLVPPREVRARAEAAGGAELGDALRRAADAFAGRAEVDSQSLARVAAALGADHLVLLRVHGASSAAGRRSSAYHDTLNKGRYVREAGLAGSANAIVRLAVVRGGDGAPAFVAVATGSQDAYDRGIDEYTGAGTVSPDSMPTATGVLRATVDAMLKKMPR